MVPPRTAVIGASGYLGRHLWQRYRQFDPEAWGSGHTHCRPPLHPFQLGASYLEADRLADQGYRALLIAAGLPNIHQCQTRSEETARVNVEGVLQVAAAAARAGLQVIYLSSDYVFAGQGDYASESPTRPTTVYGQQKVQVEQALPRLTDDFLCLRLSKIYGSLRGDGTLLDEMAGKLSGGETLTAARDQIFCPTHVDDLVAAIVQLQSQGQRGFHNLCAPERFSRHQLALSMARALGLSPSRVQEIGLYDLPSMQGRPLDTSMRCGLPGLSFRPLQPELERVARQWRGL